MTDLYPYLYFYLSIYLSIFIYIYTYLFIHVYIYIYLYCRYKEMYKFTHIYSYVYALPTSSHCTKKVLGFPQKKCLTFNQPISRTHPNQSVAGVQQSENMFCQNHPIQGLEMDIIIHA